MGAVIRVTSTFGDIRTESSATDTVLRVVDAGATWDLEGGPRVVKDANGRIVRALPARAGEITSADVVLYIDGATFDASSSIITWTATSADGSALSGVGTGGTGGTVALSFDLAGAANTTSSVKRYDLAISVDGLTWHTSNDASSITLNVLPNR